MRTTLLVIHLVGVALWLGANGVQAFVSPRVAKAPADARLWWAHSQEHMAKVLYSVAGVAILVTGVWMVLLESTPWEFSDAFVSVGLAAIVIGIVLGVVVFSPGSRHVAAAIESGDEAEEKTLSNRMAAFGILDSLIVVVTIVAMVGKWGVG
ncbi:MAG TPA: DUF2269 family protein [Microthrixaceae bacterium]|nr:DUF2269 family protein [Microthrixaceae bacterium]